MTQSRDRPARPERETFRAPAPGAGRGGAPGSIAGLQRLAGNRAVAELVSRQASARGVLMRSPSRAAATHKAVDPRTVALTVTPPREMTGREFQVYVLQVMYDESPEDAEARLEDWEAGNRRSWGHFETGIHGDEVGKPITVGVTPPVPSAGAAEDAKLRAQDFAGFQAQQQRRINDETDKRFWAKVGDEKHRRLGSARGQQGLRELWMETRDEVLREHEKIASMPAPLRDFLAPDTGEPDPAQYKAALRIGEKAKDFTAADWARYERNVYETTSDYDVAEQAVERFAAKLADEKRITERIRGTDMLFRGEHADRAAHGPGYPEEQVDLWLPTTKFATIEEYDAACDDYLRIFRDRAVEIAFLALRTSERVVRSESERYRHPEERAALDRDLGRFRDLVRTASAISYPEQGPASERPKNTYSAEEKAAWDAVDRERTLQAVIHPVLKDEDLSLGDIAYGSSEDLAQKIQDLSAEHLHAIEKSRARLVDNPEVVWQWSNVVNATKKEMGADTGAIHEMVVDEHLKHIREDHQLKAMGMAVLAIGLSILTFGTGTVAVVAATALLAQGVYMGVEEVKAYGDAYAAAHTAFDAAHSLSPDSPSAFWAAFALISAGLDGINLVNVLKAVAEPLSVLETTGNFAKFDASLVEISETLPADLKAALSPTAKAVIKRALKAKAKLDPAARSFGQAWQAADAVAAGGTVSAKTADELARCGYIGSQMGMRDFAEFAAYVQTGPLRKFNVSALSPEQIDALKQAWAKGVARAESKGVALKPSTLKPPAEGTPGEPGAGTPPADPAGGSPGDPARDPGADPARDPGADQDVDPASEAGAGEGAPKTPKAPPGARHPTVEKLREAVDADLNKLTAGTDEAGLNRHWRRIRDELDTLPDTPENNWIRQHVQTVYEGVRSRKVISDLIVEIWQRAAVDEITTTEELVKIAGRGKPLKLLPAKQLSPEDFGMFLRERVPRIDTYFKSLDHGAYTHVFDDLIVGKVLGGADEAVIFRRMLTDMTGPELDGYPFWARLWDALFDEVEDGQINTPEMLGPILHRHLGIDLAPPAT